MDWSSTPSFHKLYISCWVCTSLLQDPYHPNCNGGVERVNHTMAQMLAMVVNERQDDWDLHLPHAELAYNNFVIAVTGLAPN